MSLIIKQHSKTNVTIVSPAKVRRYEQGSGPLAQILRNGRIIIFQFVEDIIHTAKDDLKRMKILFLNAMQNHSKPSSLICQTDSQFLD
jgi:hypothetical protein